MSGWHLYVSGDSRIISKRALYQGYQDLGTPIASDLKRSPVFHKGTWYVFKKYDHILEDGGPVEVWDLPAPVKNLYAAAGLIELY